MYNFKKTDISSFGKFAEIEGKQNLEKPKEDDLTSMIRKIVLESIKSQGPTIPVGLNSGSIDFAELGNSFFSREGPGGEPDIYKIDTKSRIVRQYLWNNRETIDWDKISKKTMDIEFVEKFKDFIKFDIIDSIVLFENDYEIIRKYSDKFNLEEVSKRIVPDIRQDQLTSFVNLDMIPRKFILANTRFYEDILEHENSDDWKILSKSRYLTYTFIEDNFDKLDLSEERIKSLISIVPTAVFDYSHITRPSKTPSKTPRVVSTPPLF
jgi:hypothetical protein